MFNKLKSLCRELDAALEEQRVMDIKEKNAKQALKDAPPLAPWTIPKSSALSAMPGPCSILSPAAGPMWRG